MLLFLSSYFQCCCFYLLISNVVVLSTYFQCCCFHLLISNVAVLIYLFPMLLFLSDPTVLTYDHSLPESSYRSHPLHCLYNPADLEALWPHPKYREINKNTIQSCKPIKNSIHFALGENSVKTI